MDTQERIRIVRIDESNYPLFDDMVFLRMNGRERTAQERGEPRDYAMERRELGHPGLWVYAAETEGRFVAWISVVYMPKVGRTHGYGYLYVDELWTAPQYRRQGIAQRLLQAAEEITEPPVMGMRLYADDPGAIALYRKCGYTVLSDTACFMEKGL